LYEIYINKNLLIYQQINTLTIVHIFVSDEGQYRKTSCNSTCFIAITASISLLMDY